MLVLAAAGIRLVDLGVPDRVMFDELYYAGDAQQYLERGVEDVRPAHPPLGKWLIAFGIAGFGNDPFGWRISAVVAGVVTVLATYLAGLRLLNRPWAPLLAGLLVAVDGLAFTMSRIAMLDAFLAMFVAAGFVVLLEHRRTRAAGRDGNGWLLAVGLLLGAAVATKWAGLLAVFATVAVVVVDEGLRWRRGSLGATGLRSRLCWAALCLLVVPSAVYVGSYASWFANVERSGTGQRLCEEGSCPEGLGVVRAWVGEQTATARYHRDLTPRHPDRSGALGWPLLQRPVLHYFERCQPDDPRPGEECRVAPGHRAKIMGLGNPVIWWAALATYPVLGWLVLVRRDVGAGILLLFLLALWLPWVVSGKPGYFFYMLPVVPFMCLGLARVAERSAERRLLRPLPVVLAAAAVACFAFFYPVYSGTEAPKAELDLRIWFESWR